MCVYDIVVVELRVIVPVHVLVTVRGVRVVVKTVGAIDHVASDTGVVDVVEVEETEEELGEEVDEEDLEVVLSATGCRK